MPRPLRVEYAGAIYHVLNRGDRQEPIVRDDQDRVRFLETLGETCLKTHWQVLAVCLMPNHFHLVVETPQANLVAGMKWFLGTYTSRFNRRHRQFGHLFSGRYKALIIDGDSPGYLRTVCDYVHLNPSRARLLAKDQPLARYRWSSYPQYLRPARHRPPWLKVERLLGEYGLRRDDAAGRRRFARQLEHRRAAETGADWQKLRRGWLHGSSEFRERLLARGHEHAGESHLASYRHDTDAAHAERMVRDELQRRGWKEPDLQRRPKGDPEKVRIASRLRRETTMTLKWIAARLNMGTWTHVSNRLSQRKRSPSVNTKD
ncbi:MAG TPA: transposase [Verrucomicrobiae bacterium]|nr:transposase [Verrucomicrobiae bacterium]